MLIKTLNDTLWAKGLKLATAESCTGGMIGAAITDLAGSSDVFDRGFITYSNEAKMQMLGVKPETLEAHGAVSEPTAREMALGALAHSLADIAISVTGIAGPGGGSSDKTVGLVYIGIASKDGGAHVYRHVFPGDRAAVREQTRDTALTYVLNMLKDPQS